MTMLRYLLILLAAGTVVHGANILAVFPSVWKSHYLYGRRIISTLAQRGHNVTIVSAFYSLPQPNVTEITVPDVEKNYLDMGMTFQLDEIVAKSTVEQFSKVIYAATSNVDLVLSCEPVRYLLKSQDTKFDLLLIDSFMSDALLGLSVLYDVPTVVVSPGGTNNWVNQMVGNPHNSALNPNNFLPLLENMNLRQRLTNTLMSIFEKLTYNFLYMPYHEYVYKRHFSELVARQQRTLPPLSDVVRDVSMVLVNSNPVTQYPRAFVPNMVEIGGAQIFNNISKLAKSVTNFMDDAPEGILYVSFGANLKTDDLPKEKFDALINAIRAVKGRLRVILKLESFDLEDQPTHTVVAPWLPQQEILAHPKLKVFISTVGLMSMMESIHYAAPVVGIPIFPEQERNMKRLEQLGTGVRVNYDNFTNETLVEAINDILANPKYKENAIRASNLLNDTLNSPMDLAVYNIEMVLRTNGARHLRSVATRLGFIQAELIDVSLIILLGIVMIIAVPSMVICIILRKTNNKRQTSADKSGAVAEKNGLSAKSKKKKQN